MKTFKNTVLLKYPKPLVWAGMRDHLTQLVPYLSDIALIEERERNSVSGGPLHLTNVWTADIAIPAILSSFVNRNNLGWIDRAYWHESSGICEWKIEPHFLPDALRCEGKATYQVAMGGRGTKIIFEGAFSLLSGQSSTLPAFMERGAHDAIETLVGSLIAKNFRKMTEALTLLLKKEQIKTLKQKPEKICEPA